MHATPKLSSNRLLEEIQSSAGNLDFRDCTFIPALNALISSLNQESNLSKAGLVYYQTYISRLLSNRINVERYIEQHKLNTNQRIQDPVIILGLPRTGSTKLHRMLASLGRFHTLPLWKILYPVPLEKECGRGNLRLTKSQQYSECLKKRAPGFFSVHPMLAESAEEEMFAMDMTFQTPVGFLYNHAPSYQDWYKTQDITPVYSYLKTLLTCFKHDTDKRDDKPFLLKSPMHSLHLDALFQVFPNARIIQCHRNPETVIGSFCKLTYEARKITSQQDKPTKTGRFCLGIAEEIMNLSVKSHIQTTEISILDIAYNDIASNSSKVVENVLSFLGVEVTDTDRNAVSEWEIQNTMHQFGAYSYSIEDFGLKSTDIRRAGEAYEEHFRAFI